MKKHYERIEAYKVEFNANEQVAAAACNYAAGNGQYSGTPGKTGCDFKETSSGDKMVDPSAGGGDVCQVIQGQYIMQYI